MLPPFSPPAAARVVVAPTPTISLQPWCETVGANCVRPRAAGCRPKRLSLWADFPRQRGKMSAQQTKRGPLRGERELSAVRLTERANGAVVNAQPIGYLVGANCVRPRAAGCRPYNPHPTLLYAVGAIHESPVSPLSPIGDIPPFRQGGHVFLQPCCYTVGRGLAPAVFAACGGAGRRGADPYGFYLTLLLHRRGGRSEAARAAMNDRGGI